MTRLSLELGWVVGICLLLWRFTEVESVFSIPQMLGALVAWIAVPFILTYIIRRLPTRFGDKNDEEDPPNV